MIQIVDKSKLSQEDLRDRCKEYFGHFVKFVADIKMGIIAVGGELHSDAETKLLEGGSKQSNLWGGNLYPENEPGERIEFESFINIRPRNDNTSMIVEREDIRQQITELVESLLISADELFEFGNL